MPRRTGSSQRWRARQERDIYVERANRAGWRSRAVFKLEQIQAKERLLTPGTVCVDLGSAPGSWSQLAAQLVEPRGRVVAVDLLAMEPIPGVEFLQADFTTPETVAKLKEMLGGSGVDLVMSDMAPNISGNRAMDQPRSVALLDEALLFATEVLKPGGDLLVKAFQGEGIDAFTRDLRRHFATVKTIKPKASRPESREIYLLARTYGM
jgi:23S rRNA (uridine2552-2'-O)-methyltransferase